MVRPGQLYEWDDGSWLVLVLERVLDENGGRMWRSLVIADDEDTCDGAITVDVGLESSRWRRVA